MARLLAGLLWAGSSVAFGQSAPARKTDAVIGEVTSVDAPSRRLIVKIDAGGTIDVALQEDAALLRAKPGAAALTDATPLAFAEIAIGDRVLARGALSEDRASLAARQVVVMTKDDIAQKRQADQAEWRRRGVLGVVTGVDAAKGEITLHVGRAAAGQSLVIETAGRKVVFRRYAPDSVRFSDARTSALGEVRTGDQLRALGNRGPDGARLAAEQVVFGTFRTVSGTVTILDPARSEVTLRDEEARHTLTATVGPDARVRRLSPELGARLSRVAAAGEGSEAGGPAGGRPAAGPGPGGAGAGGPQGAWRGSRGGGGPEDLLERLPPATFADLKVGDQILVVSTEGSDPARLNAIALVAGLETIVVAGARTGRAARAVDVGLPAGLLDLGMVVP